MSLKKHLRLTANLLIGVSIFTVAACAPPLTVSNVDYGQPMEAVLSPDSEGMVEDERGGLRFNIMPIQYEETGDTTQVTTEEVRVIRNQDGFYFVTAPGYQHVYVFKPVAEEAELELHEQILVDEEGIANPAFNQRTPHVQLLDGEDTEYRLTADGIVGN